MTFEIDCRFDNSPCVVTEAADRWYYKLFKLLGFEKRVNPKCRRGRVLSDKHNQYCQDRTQPRTK